MYLVILAFVAAVSISVLSPLVFAVNGLLACALFCVLCCSIFPRLRVVTSAVLGMVFAQLFAGDSLENWLSEDLQGRQMWVEGYVISLPKERARNTRFDFEVVRSQFGYKARKVSLSSFHHAAPVLPLPGEKWRFVVKLDKPHGTFNPRLFDFEAWQFSRQISAVGYIRDSIENKRLMASGWNQYHHQLRYKIRSAVTSILPDDRVRGLVVALLIGESSQIDRSTWDILSNTGTNHLLIISGLHVGLVAALIYFCLKLLSSVIPSFTRFLTLFSLAPIFFYCLMAGMGLPVQRALIMIALGMFVLQLKRNVPVFLVLLYALCVVVLLNPYSSLAAGYWLSFGAVASLIFAFSGRGYKLHKLKDKVLKSVQTQWVIFVGMAPLLIFWLHQFSLVGFIVNLIAIPFIAIFIVPILLFALFCLFVMPWAAPFTLSLAHFLLHYFMRFLDYFSELDWVYHQGVTSLLALAIALLGSMILMLPRGMIPRWLGLILFLPLILPQTSGLEEGDVRVKVLDVGQGLSVIIETQNHIVVYDAGPQWGSDVDAGERIVYPVLKTMGHRLIHTLIISHSDLDHAGGLKGLRRKATVLQYFTGEPETNGGLHCDKSRQWHLDGVEFSFLNGPKDDSLKGNDKSCVLLVTAGKYGEHGAYRIMLPGDIEAQMEERLAKHYLPAVNLLVAPHHGSLSSSTPGFLNRLHPEIIVISAGFHNKFRHPSSRVTERYRLREMNVLNTATHGAISILYQGGKVKVDTARQSNPRLWR